jgi:NADPH-dependent 2,4-dienoyl-CoA reductase/sulfur reductase-like enzyme
MLDKMVKPAQSVKKVAVVGGGPAGMEAALTAAQRGHQVTLYEAAPQLGGALITAGMPDFKWPVRDFTQWMVSQVEKADITVKLNTTATPELLAKEGYDHVIAALGGTPLVLPISGVDRAIPGPEAFLHPEKVLGDVVVIGGGEIGVEAGIYFARRGQKVTVLEMTGQFAREANRPHYYTTLLDAVRKEENLTILVNAKVSAVTETGVEYTDQEGNLHQVPAQSVVLSAGTRGKTQEALAFYEAGDLLSVIGDCQKPASLMEAMRAGFATASQI